MQHGDDAEEIAAGTGKAQTGFAGSAQIHSKIKATANYCRSKSPCKPRVNLCARQILRARSNRRLAAVSTCAKIHSQTSAVDAAATSSTRSLVRCDNAASCNVPAISSCVVEEEQCRSQYGDETRWVRCSAGPKERRLSPRRVCASTSAAPCRCCALETCWTIRTEVPATLRLGPSGPHQPPHGTATGAHGLRPDCRTGRRHQHHRVRRHALGL